MYRNSFRLTNKEIDEAFAARQFRLVYQPKIDLAKKVLIGVESFARWQHPQFGIIPPALFLPVLQRQGRNQELTRFVLGEAIAQLARWRDRPDTLTMSVNVAPEELTDGSLPVSIRLALNAHDVDPARLIVDLPERGLAADPARARTTIHALSEIGVGLALECAPEPLIDFAATDTATLDPTAFGELKIGGSAIIQFASRLEGTGLGLMRSRIEYARTNNMTATAVGAETHETVGLLPSLGFTWAQGNAISSPLSSDGLADFDVAHAMNPPGTAQDMAGQQPKKALDDFQMPESEQAREKTPRIRVVRGRAKIELMSQSGKDTHSRVLKLTLPPSPHIGSGKSRTSADAKPGLFGKLQDRLSRALHH